MHVNLIDISNSPWNIIRSDKHLPIFANEDDYSLDQRSEHKSEIWKSKNYSMQKLIIEFCKIFSLWVGGCVETIIVFRAMEMKAINFLTQHYVPLRCKHKHQHKSKNKNKLLKRFVPVPVLSHILMIFILICWLPSLLNATPQDNALCGFIAATDVQSRSGYGMWSCTDDGFTSADPCSPVWLGITCDSPTLSYIMGIDLQSIGLAGIFSSFFCMFWLAQLCSVDALKSYNNYIAIFEL